MFEYSNLRFLEEKSWILIVEGETKELEAEGFIEAFNEIGIEGWELVLLDEKAGYLFKREVK
jgi:hypothetical protein